MRYALALILFLLSSDSIAQWKADPFLGGKSYVSVMYGASDTVLFSCLTLPGGGVHPGLIARTVSTSKWYSVQGGIDWTQGTVRSFASLGRYVFAGMTTKFGEASTSWRSSNMGAHWTANAGGPVCSNGTYVFAVSDGIYRSKDSGNDNTWLKVDSYPAVALGAMGAHIFSAANGGLRVSVNSGSDWAQVTYPLSPPLSFAVASSMIFAGGYVLDYNANPYDPPVIGPKGMTFSSDSGASWMTIKNFDHYVQCLASDGKNVFVGTLDSGIYVSTDLGQSWTQHNEGLGSSLSVQAMAVFDTLLYLSSGTDGNYFNGYRPLLELVPPHNAVESPVAACDTIAIYPNPTTSNIRIDFGSAAVHRIELLNVLGASVQTVAPRSAEVVLDLSSLPSGTYFLLIETQKGVIYRKIVRE